MFALFYNLYLAMFSGRWNAFTLNGISTLNKTLINKLGELLTSIFNNVSTPLNDLGDIMLSIESTSNSPLYLHLIALILATITSIGIVVMAVKGVKKAFGIFFMGIRNI